MRLLKLVMIIGTLSVSAYMALDWFWLSSQYGSKVFKAIKNERLAYAPTLSGKVLVDFDQLTTDIYLKDLLKKQNGISPSVETIIDKKNLVFQIPLSIRKTELISRMNYEDSLSSHPGVIFKMKNLKYRVTTATTDYISTMLFIKTDEGYRLAAMYSEPG